MTTKDELHQLVDALDDESAGGSSTLSGWLPTRTSR